MTNDQLRYFLALIKYGSEASAAAHMLVNERSFARSMKALEEELQVKLYDRQRGRAKRILLTPFGEYFIDFAKAMLNLEAKRQEDFASIALGQTPIVKIAVAPALNQPLHKHSIIPFAQEHPNFRWSALQLNVPEMEKAILTGAAEIGFATTELLHPDDFEILATIPSRYYIICRKDTKWLDIHQSYKLKDLAEIPLFLTFNSQNLLHSRFQSMSIKPNIRSTNFARAVSIFNTHSDLGITICPASHPPENQELTWVPLDEPDMLSQNTVFKNPNHILSPMAQEFVDYYKEHIHK